MYTLLIILIVLASILMCGIVLIQESKGGGLASGFSSSNQFLGVRKTTDVIEKTTWALAIAMVVLSVAAAYCVPTVTTDKSVLDGEVSNPVSATTLPGVENSQAPAESAAPAEGAAPQAAQ